MQSSPIQFELHPVAASTLAEVAKFLYRWHTNEKHSSNSSTSQTNKVEGIEGIKHRLDWLLQANPQMHTQGMYGFCIRDSVGEIRGLDLSFPIGFVSPSERYLALCSSSFLVEPCARSMGFFLFKKVLGVPNYAFYFASTCNGNSGEIWKHMGGQPVPESETEFIIPLRLERLMAMKTAQLTSCRTAARLAGIAGHLVNPIFRSLTRRRSTLKTEPCRDWDKLSVLFQHHQDSSYLSAERSPAILQWRYGLGSPIGLGSIFVFRDERGNEGWFSHHPLRRGLAGELRWSMLLDLVWPRDRVALSDVLSAIVNTLPSDVDGLVFRAKPGFDTRGLHSCIIRRRLRTPRAFVKMPAGAQQIPLHLLDCDDSDFVAWTF